MSGLIFRKKRDFFVRLPLGIILIALFAISPILIAMAGAWIIELRTGEPCHEGNCAWAAIGWLFMLTFPIAGLLFIIFAVILLIDTINLIRQSGKEN